MFWKHFGPKHIPEMEIQLDLHRGRKQPKKIPKQIQNASTRGREEAPKEASQADPESGRPRDDL